MIKFCHCGDVNNNFFSLPSHARNYVFASLHKFRKNCATFNQTLVKKMLHLSSHSDAHQSDYIYASTPTHNYVHNLHSHTNSDPDSNRHTNTNTHTHTLCILICYWMLFIAFSFIVSKIWKSNIFILLRALNETMLLSLLYAKDEKRPG